MGYVPFTSVHGKVAKGRGFRSISVSLLRRPKHRLVPPEEPCGEDAHGFGELLKLTTRWGDLLDM